MTGEIDPFKMMAQLPRHLFLYWKTFKQLHLTELHKKEHYYYAQICQAIIAANGGEAGSLDSYLIKFKARTAKEIEEEERNKDMAFFSGLHSFNEKRKIINSQK